jgi:transcription initiation factor TFIIB
MDTCPHCGSKKLLTDKKRGETFCLNCGAVLEQEIDVGQEWTAGEDSEGKARAGAPISWGEATRGLSTQIGSLSDTGKMTKRQRDKLKRLQQEHQRSKTKVERNVQHGLIELRRFASLLNLPNDIAEEAARNYRMAVEKNLIRGRTIESVVVGIIYIILRQFNIPRSLNEVTQNTNTPKHDVVRAYKFIARSLGLKLQPSGPEDYVPKFANRLNLSAQVQTEAIRILRDAKVAELMSGRGPIGLAAAALYIAALLKGVKMTQRQISDAVGVTEVTIRNRYKELIEALNLTEKLEPKEKI